MEFNHDVEPTVSADSSTETFAAIKLFIDNWRWHDVPFDFPNYQAGTWGPVEEPSI